MSEHKWAPGTSAIYDGIMQSRKRQEVKCGNTVSGLVSCTFSDQTVIGCEPRSLRPA